MASLFEPDGRLSPRRAMGWEGQSSQECRRRAVECRALAETCLTAEAAGILRDLAVELDEQARNRELTKASPIGSGRY